MRKGLPRLTSRAPTGRSWWSEGAPEVDEAAEREKCAQQLEAFLMEHSKPLAILLKPMHEVRDLSAGALAKTAAIGYGSFNTEQTRKTIVSDAEAAGNTVGDQEAHSQLMSLFSKFHVMVERATSVGRVESLSEDQPIWRFIESDPR